MALTALPVSTSAAPVVIDFEDLSTNGPGEGGQVTVFHQYAGIAGKGINFNEPVALDYSKGSAPRRYQGFAHSGTKAIEQCYEKEFCDTPIVMNFTIAQRRVKVWVGYSDNLGKQETVILSTFDSAGVPIRQTTATFQPSTAPIPIRTPLEVKSDSQNIYSATVSFVPDADAHGRVYNHNLAVDDIEFDTAGPPPPCVSTRNPIVTLASPTPGQIVRFNAFNLQGTISTTAPLESATLIINGSSGSHSLDLLGGGIHLSRNGGTVSAYGITDLLFLGSNTIIVRAQDCKGSGEGSTTLTFQPCDSTTSPVVTITNPSTPGRNIVSTDSFKLTGKINSSAKLESVTITITAGPPNSDSHRFNINPDNEGAFDVTVSSENLFQGTENTITVTAQNTEGCSGEKSTTIVFDNRILQWQPALAFRAGTPEEARHRQDLMREVLAKVIWPKPTVDPLGLVDPRILPVVPQPTSVRLTDHTERNSSLKLYELHLQYDLRFKDLQNAQRREMHWWLAIPKNAQPSTTPAVLCLHGHNGSGDAVMHGKGIYWYGKSLAELGYVVIAPDLRHGGLIARTDGDYQFDQDRWSRTGERVWDCLACIDYLCTLPEVNPKRLGVVGLSLGGETAMYVGALDKRIQITVSSGFLTTMATMRNGRHCGCWWIEGLELLFDYSDIFCLVAPRTLVCENGIFDSTGFPIEVSRLAFERIVPAYRLSGGTPLHIEHRDKRNDGHWFSGEAFGYIDAVLKAR